MIPAVTARRRVWPWAVPPCLLALLAALPALSMPHFRGDEPVFLALGAQLRAGAPYSLRHVDVWVEPLPAGEGLVLVSIRRGDERRGSLIRYYAGGGEDYHDAPVSNYGPLLPAALALSQRLLGGDRSAVLAVDPQHEARARAAGSLAQLRRAVHTRAARGEYPLAAQVARWQLPALLPSLLGAVLAPLGAFWLGWRATGQAPLGCLTALLVATAPVQLLAAHLVQSDVLAAALAALGAALALEALLEPRPRRAARWAALAGLVLGLGVLAKPQAALVGVAYGLTELGLACRRGTLAARLLPLAAFSAPALALSVPWVVWVGAAAVPYAEGSARYLERGAFGTWVMSRSWSIYPLNLLYFSPQLLLGALLLWRPGVRPRPGCPTGLARRCPVGLAFALVTLLLFGLATWGYAGRESRYLLPVYPALALLAALACARLGRATGRRLGASGRALLGLLVGLLLARSLQLGGEAVRGGLTHWNAEAFPWF